jgi:hypothetical protein
MLRKLPHSETLYGAQNAENSLIHECSSRGIVTTEQAHQLNYHCDLLLHGGRFDWEHYFEKGACAVLERKSKQRSKEERQKFEERARYLKIEKCIDSWSKKQPLARFAYNYLCDLVHPNKGSNLVLLVKREQSILFDVDGSIELGHLIFDRIPQDKEEMVPPALRIRRAGSGGPSIRPSPEAVAQDG